MFACIESTIVYMNPFFSC